MAQLMCANTKIGKEGNMEKIKMLMISGKQAKRELSLVFKGTHRVFDNFFLYLNLLFVFILSLKYD